MPDAEVEKQITDYLGKVGGTPYYDILTEYSYYNGQLVNGGPILNSSRFGGAYLDTAPFPDGAGTASYPLSDSDVFAELKAIIAAKSWPTNINALYFVYTPGSIDMCFGPGIRSDCDYDVGGLAAQTCASHTFDYLPGNAFILFAAMGKCPNVDFTAHEQFEMVTDPGNIAPTNLFGWRDSTGEEIADQCHYQALSKVTLRSEVFQVPPIWSNLSGDCTTTSTYIAPAPTATPITMGTPVPTATPVPTRLRVDSVVVVAKLGAHKSLRRARLGQNIYVIMRWTLYSTPNTAKPAYELLATRNGKTVIYRRMFGDNASYLPDHSYAVAFLVKLTTSGTYNFKGRVSLNEFSDEGSSRLTVTR